MIHNKLLGGGRIDKEDQLHGLQGKKYQCQQMRVTTVVRMSKIVESRARELSKIMIIVGERLMRVMVKHCYVRVLLELQNNWRNLGEGDERNSATAAVERITLGESAQIQRI